MNFELTANFNNFDSGHSAEWIISFEANDDATQQLVAACRAEVTEDSLEKLFKHLYDNPEMEASGTGVAYDAIWSQMSRFAYDKLGWHDVTVDVFGLTVDDFVFEIDPDALDISRWALQLSREGFMYCKN
jgi:hypothetical protein